MTEQVLFPTSIIGSMPRPSFVKDLIADDSSFSKEEYQDWMGSAIRSVVALQEAAGLDVEFVQDNQSLSRPKGTVRGLHFQVPPFAQAKLVRVTRGAVLDIAVDIRKGSPTYGNHIAVELSAEAWNQLYIPEGFAHGFCTLEPDTELLYKVSAPYSRDDDRGIAWNDPDLGIEWPVAEEDAVLSEKDAVQPAFADLPAYF